MLVRCESCKGKGHVWIESWGINVTCDVCHGKCGFDIPAGKELCPDCKGKGKVEAMIQGALPGFDIPIDVNCENCFGTGFIDKIEE